jgi:hypothetical protein
LSSCGDKRKPLILWVLCWRQRQAVAAARQILPRQSFQASTNHAKSLIFKEIKRLARALL